METTFNDMSSDEKICFLVNAMSDYLFLISREARTALRPLGFTPEKAKEYRLLALIEGERFGGNEGSGAMDLLDHLRYTLAADYDVEGLYQDDEEDEEEDDESESDELESVEA